MTLEEDLAELEGLAGHVMAETSRLSSRRFARSSEPDDLAAWAEREAGGGAQVSARQASTSFGHAFMMHA